MEDTAPWALLENEDMSGGKACACPEKKKAVPLRAWRILQWRCNHSAFNGYARTPSDYSSIQCTACGAVWRTKSPYVEKLPMRAGA